MASFMFLQGSCLFSNSRSKKQVYSKSTGVLPDYWELGDQVLGKRWGFGSRNRSEGQASGESHP